MAVAWAISTIYLKYPVMTLEYLNNNNLDNWTFNKTIQKIIESKQVSLDEKTKLKALKREQKDFVSV